MTRTPCTTTARALGKGRSQRQPGRAAGPCTSAVDTARHAGRGHVVIHPEACHNLRDLDGAPEGRSWGRKIARALAALEAYGQALDDGFRGNFYHWCDRSGHVDAWPASTKKLSMHESDTVLGNARLRRARVLPICRGVGPTGAVLMEPHLKIAEGGGDLAPRIYFTVDLRTNALHIGYIGPHKRMRNTRS